MSNGLLTLQDNKHSWFYSFIPHSQKPLKSLKRALSITHIKFLVITIYRLTTDIFKGRFASSSSQKPLKSLKRALSITHIKFLVITIYRLTTDIFKGRFASSSSQKPLKSLKRALSITYIKFLVITIYRLTTDIFKGRFASSSSQKPLKSLTRALSVTYIKFLVITIYRLTTDIFHARITCAVVCNKVFVSTFLVYWVASAVDGRCCFILYQGTVGMSHGLGFLLGPALGGILYKVHVYWQHLFMNVHINVAYTHREWAMVLEN